MVGMSIARSTRSGTLVGPGIWRKCRPVWTEALDMVGAPRTIFACSFCALRHYVGKDCIQNFLFHKAKMRYFGVVKKNAASFTQFARFLNALSRSCIIRHGREALDFE
jgi:hypothetical protein